MNFQTSKIAQNIRLQEWGRMIQECKSRPTGMTIGEWCAQHNITKCDYYYRMRAVRKACILLWNRGLIKFSFAGIILEHFIEQSAGWSSLFFIETEHDDAEENVDVSCEVTEYTCHSMKEFADVLKNDCRIVLDFAESNILDGIYDTENIRVEGCQGSWQLELCDLSNVEIVGKHTRLISDKAGADVLTLRNCYNVKVSDVVLGHNIEMGSCDGVVVSVVGGYGVTLDSVEMYGCGTYGVYGRDGNVEIINCDIHDCSIGAINLEECICRIENTKIHNCIHAYDNIITSNTELTLVNIEIYDNITEHAIVFGVKYLTNFKNVYIHHNKYRKNPLVLMRQDGVRWEKNEQLPWL